MESSQWQGNLLCSHEETTELSEHSFMILSEKKCKLYPQIFQIWLDSFGNLAALFQEVMMIL